MHTKRMLIQPAVMLTGMFAMTVLMLYAGHNGGALTHGSDYLTLQTLTYSKRPKPASISETYIFEDVVQPILQNKCGQCHNGSKLKGKLSIESLQTLLKGGKHGAAITPFNLAESDLYKRITLDPADEKFMPTNGKTPLTKSETAIIKWWIENGAVEQQKLLAMKHADSITPKVNAWLGFQQAETNANEATVTQHINPNIPKAADTAAIAFLISKGWQVRYMLKQPVMLDITKPGGSTSNISDAVHALRKLAANIIWLNVSGNNLTDKDLVFLPALSNLEKLRLERNTVTDAVCEQLVSLQHLEAVNLNETEVTDKGLALLKKNQALKRVYSWKGE